MVEINPPLKLLVHGHMVRRLAKLFLSIVFSFLMGILSLFSLFRKKRVPTLVVLTYHSVKPSQRKKFAKQMDIILKNGKPVFAEIQKKFVETAHHIAVTFDDGFQSFLENAYPEMVIRNIPATLFIPTGYLGKLPGWINNPEHENAGEILITEEQLKTLPVEIVQVGSHCITHPRLTSLSKEQIAWELAESKQRLEKLLENEVTLLSFPYDDYSEGIVDMVKEVGYLRAFRDVPTYPASAIDNFLVGRISVSPEDWNFEYRLKVKGAYQWLPFGVAAKQMLMKTLRTNRGDI